MLHIHLSILLKVNCTTYVSFISVAANKGYNSVQTYLGVNSFAFSMTFFLTNSSRIILYGKFGTGRKDKVGWNIERERTV